MRGNRAAYPTMTLAARSIPAYAGEPITASAPSPSWRVYPRVCGGTITGCSRRLYRRGLSPRMRGNQPHQISAPVSDGSIPAYAGEPRKWFSSPRRVKVYPRVCGGTSAAIRKHGGGRGLSPRMRGNPVHRKIRALNPGSIPAYAGEPPPTPASPRESRVYPRVCGGTPVSAWPSAPHCGLSPRMRGNPTKARRHGYCLRSIPAYAGEPGHRMRLQLHSRVYPRVCGGTFL